MRFQKHTVAAAALVFALACGRGDEDFTDSTPDMEGLAAEISDAAAEGVTTSGLSSSSEGLVSDGGMRVVPEYLQHARDAVRRLNDMIRRAVSPIVGLISRGGRLEPGSVRVYGPRDSDGATWRLTIKRVTVNSFAWKLEAKPIGADDSAYLLIVGGGVRRGSEAHRGRGLVGVNFDNLAIVMVDNPDFHGAGKLLAAFAHVESSNGRVEAKSLAYVLSGFTPDSTQHEPVSAALVAHKLLPSGASGIRLLARADLRGTATDAKETVGLRVRWIPGVGGAGAARASGGDIPVGTWYRGFACWDENEQEGYKIVQSCTGTVAARTCTTLPNYPVGALANCRTNLSDDDLPAPDDNERDSVAPEQGAPDMADPLAPPMDVPAGDEI